MRILVFLLVASLAFAEGTTTTHLWIPERPDVGGPSGWPGTDINRCVSFIAPLSIANATQITARVTGGLGGGGLCSFTIYDAAGSAIIATTGAIDCSATGNVTGAPAAFSLTAGTKYLACTCANTSGGSYLAASSISGELTTLQNALSNPIGTVAANNCTAAVPPSSTGALSAAAVNLPILLVGTASP